MVVPLVTHGHALFLQSPAAFGVDAQRRRNDRHIAAEYTAHVVKQLRTLYARKKDPSKLTVEQLRKLGRGLHIPVEEMRAALRY